MTACSLALSELISIMSEINEKMCVICWVDLETECLSEPTFTVTERGLETLKKFSELRNDVQLSEYLHQEHTIVTVHEGCRKDYTNKKSYEQLKRRAEESESKIQTKVLRSASISFDWKQHCFLCSKSAVGPTGKPLQDEASAVETIELRDNILEICNQRKDEWGTAVQARLQMCIDLPAAEAVYHRSCLRVFIKMKPSPKSDFQSSSGRPVDPHMSMAFNKLCEWLEVADEELYTLDELQDRMREMGGSDVVYSTKQLKRKLKDKYKEHIFFAEICGKKNVICIRDMASRIINNRWYSEREKDFVDESQRIVRAAAKLIKAEIRDAPYDNKQYPTEFECSELKAGKQWLPSLLSLFMENVIGNERKQVFISQSIVQAARPKSVISPILFGLGVSLDHTFDSQWLLDLLSRNGFSVSYDEVNTFKQSVVQSENSDMPQSYPTAFTQWSGDNVDHNVHTLDGSNTFHGMGIISMTTPYTRFASVENLNGGQFAPAVVLRLPHVKVGNLTKDRGIPIIYYTLPEKCSLSLLRFKPIQHFYYPYVLPTSVSSHLVWDAGIVCMDEGNPRPNWSGFMQQVSSPTGNF